MAKYYLVYVSPTGEVTPVSGDIPADALAEVKKVAKQPLIKPGEPGYIPGGSPGSHYEGYYAIEPNEGGVTMTRETNPEDFFKPAYVPQSRTGAKPGTEYTRSLRDLEHPATTADWLSKTTPVPTPAGAQGGMPPSPELRDKTRKPGFAPYEGYGWQWNDTVNQWQQVKNGAYGEHLKTITPHPEPQRVPIEGFGNYGIPLAPGYKPTTPTTPAREAPISPVTPTAPVTVSKMPSDLLEQAKAFEATLGTSWKSFGETPASGAIQGRHRADISSLVPGIKRI